MENIALWIGYGVIILGLCVVGLFSAMKIVDYIPTPRKYIYKLIDTLARKEPEIFLRMLLYFKRKYNLKHKSISHYDN